MRGTESFVTVGILANPFLQLLCSVGDFKTAGGGGKHFCQRLLSFCSANFCQNINQANSQGRWLLKIEWAMNHASAPVLEFI